MTPTGEVLAAFLKLGLTSFGGPVAHISYFREEFVVRRKWLDEGAFADLMALCQFLPGPASSQIAISIGLLRAGYSGAIAALVAFALPSAVLMSLFAAGLSALTKPTSEGWVHGLQIAAVAVVAQALLGMMKTLAPDRVRATLAVACAGLVMALPSTGGLVLAIVVGGIVGDLFLPAEVRQSSTTLENLPSRPVAVAALILLALVPAVLLLGAVTIQRPFVQLAEVFYRAGTLVFGGGHVVLPLLQSAIVPQFLDAASFLAGYGAAQAVPGPLVTFAAYLGMAIGGWSMAVICLVAIFLPSFLLVIGTLPFWSDLRGSRSMQAAMRGINAAVVGLLLAAFYNSAWVAGIHSKGDFFVGAAAFLLLLMWRAPPWAVVIACALAAEALTLI